ncbi:MAG TPA: hypothetical protein VKZ59_05220 [Acidobacteriota bacterium]|nr:hypothetical protein [Acidobacteriota bacterium]
MNCEQIHELLAESLSWEWDEEVMRHLKECHECSKFCDDLKTLAEMTADLQNEEPVPPEFQNQVFYRLSQSRGAKKFVTPIILILGVIAAGSFYWYGGDKTEPDWAPASSASAEVQLNDELEGETTFLEVEVDSSPEGGYILRLPSVIRIKHSNLHEESYITNVSH